MRLKHPLLIRILGFVLFLVVRLCTRTLRYRFAYSDGRCHPTPTSNDRFIYAMWHDLIIAPTVQRCDCHLLISKHRDGEWLSQVCQRMGFGVVRGSTNRGGFDAMRQLLQKSKTTHICVTPDGPLGPRRRVQPGLIYLASRSGLPIVPCGVGLAHAWRLRSWDRFAIPIPFSDATIVYGEPIYIPAKIRRTEFEEYRLAVEEQLEKVTQTAQMWADGKRMVVTPTENSAPLVPMAHREFDRLAG